MHCLFKCSTIGADRNQNVYIHSRKRKKQMCIKHRSVRTSSASGMSSWPARKTAYVGDVTHLKFSPGGRFLFAGLRKTRYSYAHCQLEFDLTPCALFRSTLVFEQAPGPSCASMTPSR